MAIPTQQQYEAREFQLVVSREREISQAPLSDRREAQAAYLEAMRTPGLVAERVSWAIDGNYGFGVGKVCAGILGRKRSNRVANLAQMVAVHEWQCPTPMAREAWHELSTFEQERLAREIGEVIATAERADD